MNSIAAELIEKIGGQLVQKAENRVSGFFDQHADQHAQTKK